MLSHSNILYGVLRALGSRCVYVIITFWYSPFAKKIALSTAYVLSSTIHLWINRKAMKSTSGIFFSLKTEQIILTTWCTPSQIIQQYKLVRRRQGIRGRIHTKCLICHYAPQNSSITGGVITGQTLLLPQRKVVMNKSSELSYPPRFIAVQLVISPPNVLSAWRHPTSSNVFK